MGEQDKKLDSINKNLTEILKAHNEKLNQIADLIKEVSKIQESNFNHMNEYGLKKAEIVLIENSVSKSRSKKL